MAPFHATTPLTTSLGLAGARFLSCEDFGWAKGEHSVRNPLAVCSSVLILGCPLYATWTWLRIGARKSTVVAFCLPIWCLFSHNLYHHTYALPTLEIETFATFLFSATVVLAGSSRKLAAFAVFAAVAAAIADHLATESLQLQFYVNNACGPVLGAAITAVALRPQKGPADGAKYLLAKIGVLLPILSVSVEFFDGALCSRGVPGAALWHAIVIHGIITVFFTCVSNLSLLLYCRNPGAPKAALRRALLYDTVAPGPPRP
ncbi:hypothetical protein M885DRAFT_530794 [Pelagophyceae sp. CCMP2097]|nr:hypothetical protein M885DRAFT_530794 [Pelagophyceae sp. CCMP2097]